MYLYVFGHSIKVFKKPMPIKGLKMWAIKTLNICIIFTGSSQIMLNSTNYAC